MLFHDLATTSEQVGATASRLVKVDRLAAFLRRLTRAETRIAVAYLSGELPQGKIGVGYATLPRPLPEPATPPPGLSILDVHAALADVAASSGPGSQATRRRLLTDLLAAATSLEQGFLTRLLLGELRQGALEGVMVEAIARAHDLPPGDVRRAVMLSGDSASVAASAQPGDRPGLSAFRLELFRPLRPMLARSAGTPAEALRRTGPAACEVKLDGARIQVHRLGDRVGIYTRSLQDVTERVPELVEAVLALPVAAVVLDGEAITLRPDGRPGPFQVTMSRFGSTRAATGGTRLSPFFFDCLHLDGDDLIDRPGSDRWSALERVVPEGLRVARIVTDSAKAAGGFLEEALRSGHEGILVKSQDSRYEAGRRGDAWVKVKPAHTLDLVVLAVEWGSGRRTGLLSNLHLGARDPDTGGFVMLGKTFKGLTDEMLGWQTERFLVLETHREGHVVHVRPEQVVEVAFDGIQTSSRYPGGLALRFARVKGYREDKSAADADTIDSVRAIFSRSSS